MAADDTADMKVFKSPVWICLTDSWGLALTGSDLQQNNWKNFPVKVQVSNWLKSSTVSSESRAEANVFKPQQAERT